jgi:tripartite-type tricarboxylate transporter receptor subunit TctC
MKQQDPTALAMKLPRRRFLSLATLAIACPAVSRAAIAYPTRPVRMLVGFAAGGAPDIAARLVGQWLSERSNSSSRTGRGPAAISRPKR